VSRWPRQTQAGGPHAALTRQAGETRLSVERVDLQTAGHRYLRPEVASRRTSSWISSGSFGC